MTDSLTKVARRSAETTREIVDDSIQHTDSKYNKNSQRSRAQIYAAYVQSNADWVSTRHDVEVLSLQSFVFARENFQECRSSIAWPGNVDANTQALSATVSQAQCGDRRSLRPRGRCTSRLDLHNGHACTCEEVLH